MNKWHYEVLSSLYHHSIPIIFFIITLLLTTVIYKLIIYTLNRIEIRFKKNHELAELIVHFSKKVCRVIYILVFLNIVISYITVSSLHREIFSKLTYTLIIMLSAWTLMQFLNLAEDMLRKYLSRSDFNSVQNIQSLYKKLQLVKKMVDSLIVVFAISVILMQFEGVKNLGISLIASAGFLTALLGIAAQKSLSSILTGFQLIFSQPVKLNDVVIIEKEYGTIEKITLGYTIVKLWDLRRIVVPTSFFLEKPFQNWTYSDSDLIGTIFLYVDFILPINPLREELKKQLDQAQLWDKKSYALEVTDLKETCIELRILVSASNPSNLWNLKVLIREKMLEFINKNYPHAFPKRYLSIDRSEKVFSNE